MSLVPIIQQEVDRWIKPVVVDVNESAALTDSTVVCSPDSSVLRIERARRWIALIQALR